MSRDLHDNKFFKSYYMIYNINRNYVICNLNINTSFFFFEEKNINTS